MRLILKKTRKAPKAPKNGTLKSIDNYLKRLREVEAYNKQVHAYNKALTGKAQYAQRAVAGFGKSKSKGKK